MMAAARVSLVDASMPPGNRRAGPPIEPLEVEEVAPLAEGRTARQRERTTPLASRGRRGREGVGGFEIEVAVIRAEPTGHQRGRSTPEHGGVARVPPQPEPDHEPGRERVAAAGGIDDVDVERGDPHDAVAL